MPSAAPPAPDLTRGVGATTRFNRLRPLRQASWVRAPARTLPSPPPFMLHCLYTPCSRAHLEHVRRHREHLGPAAVVFLQQRLPQVVLVLVHAAEHLLREGRAEAKTYARAVGDGRIGSEGASDGRQVLNAPDVTRTSAVVKRPRRVKCLRWVRWPGHERKGPAPCPADHYRFRLLPSRVLLCTAWVSATPQGPRTANTPGKAPRNLQGRDGAGGEYRVVRGPARGRSST